MPWCRFWCHKRKVRTRFHYIRPCTSTSHDQLTEYYQNISNITFQVKINQGSITYLQVHNTSSQANVYLVANGILGQLTDQRYMQTPRGGCKLVYIDVNVTGNNHLNRPGFCILTVCCISYLTNQSARTTQTNALDCFIKHLCTVPLITETQASVQK